MMGSEDMVNPSQATDEVAFRRLKAEIDEQYAPGRFLAIAGGVVIDDAAAFEDLVHSLKGRGLDPRNTLIVQAGVDQPAEAIILSGNLN